jgi:restriction system protein
MAVPKYHEFMKPILEEIKDGDEFSMSDMKSRMAERFKLSEEECKELLPSGTEAVFSNRVGWARTYLKKAGLLTIPKPSWIKITERGQEVLKEDIEEITASYLRKFPEFVEFQTPSNNKKNEKNINEHEDETPVETLETAFRQIKKGLKKELIDHIMDCNPFFFEKTVIDLLLNLGYGGSRKEAGEAFMTSGDGGIDGVIKEDKLGLDLIYIQAKRWERR